MITINIAKHATKDRQVQVPTSSVPVFEITSRTN